MNWYSKILLPLCLFTFCCYNGYTQILVEEERFRIENFLDEPVIICNQLPNSLPTEIQTIALGSVEYTFQVPQTSLVQGVPYAVVSEENGITYQLWFSLLPIVDITVTAGLNAVNGSTEEAGVVKVTDIDGQSFVSDIGIRYRGASSQTFPKKPFRLQLRRGDGSGGWEYWDESVLGMRSDKRWLMLAVYNERLRINNKVSHDLWLDMHQLYYSNLEPDAKSTIRSKFVLTFVDGQYRGIYLFAENTDRKQYKLKKEGSGQALKGELYKAAQLIVPNFFKQPEDVPIPVPSEPMWDQWELEYPDYSNWENLYDFSQFVMYSSDNDFKNHIGEKVKLENVIDYILFVNLVGAIDNLGKNLFLAKYDVGHPYFYGVWDLDGTWGYHPFTDRTYHIPYLLSNDFFNRLISLNPNNFNSKLAARWVSLRGNVLSVQNLQDKFLAQYNFLSTNGVYSLEQIVKDRAGNWHKNWLSYSQEELDYALWWMKDRAEWLDAYFDTTPLPVSLVYFKLNQEKGVDVLKWKTTQEMNSDRFEIELSRDGKKWNKIGSKTAEGQEKDGTTYEFMYEVAQNGVNYYRLKLIDKDGSFAYSNIITSRQSNGIDVVFYPNPATDLLVVSLPKSTRLRTIELFDVLGNKVKEEKVDSEEVVLDVRKYRGVYIVRIVEEEVAVSISRVLVL